MPASDPYIVVVTYPDGETGEYIGPFATAAEANAWVELAKTESTEDGELAFSEDDTFALYQLLTPIIPAGNNGNATK